LPNLFLGFPVPRAKIASMIEGSAPPLEHAPWHEPDGSDPIILPADIIAGQIVKWTGIKFIGIDAPTGGIPDLYSGKGLFFLDTYNTLDGYRQTKSVTGSILLTSTYVYISTGLTATGRADILKETGGITSKYSWEKGCNFLTRVNVAHGNDSGSLQFIGTGSYGDGERGFGFEFINTKIRGYSVNGGTQVYVDLITGLGNAYSANYEFEAIYTPGSKIEFYLDGVKKGEITTQVPTGTGNRDFLLRHYVRSSENVEHNMYIYYSKFWQGE